MEGERRGEGGKRVSVEILYRILCPHLHTMEYVGVIEARAQSEGRRGVSSKIIARLQFDTEACMYVSEALSE